MRVSRSYWLGLGSGLILSAMLTLLASSQQGQALISHKLTFFSIRQQVTDQAKTEVTAEKESVSGLASAATTQPQSELTPPSKPSSTSTSPPQQPSSSSSSVSSSVSSTPTSTAESNSSEVPKAKDAAIVKQDELTARFVFKQTCWIEVKVDGQPSIKGTYSAGASKEVKGAKKIELVSVGNAGGLTITLNGKTLPSLGKSGRVLHNVMLTTDTLKSL